MQQATNKTNVTLPTEREILVTRAFDAPIDLVFDAWTSCEHMPHWMLGPDGWTMPICENDLRPGGAYRWGWRKSDGETMEITGEYREVTPPTRVVAIERWGGGWAESINTIDFIEENGKTTVSCAILYPSKEARDAAQQTGMEDGMAISFDRLDDYLRTIA